MKRILTLTLLALSAGAHAQSTVKLATLSPLSGSISNLGAQVRNGAQLAVNEYKAPFKKLGFDLVLAPYDDQADPATGTAAARKIAADRQVLAVVGALNSGVTIPATAALSASRVAVVNSGSTANQVTDRGLKNVSRIVPRDDAQGPAGASFLTGTLKARRVYILNDKTAYGEGLAGEVEKTLKARGVKVLANEGTEEKSDFSGVVAKIKLQRPDAIYFGGVYNQVGVFLAQLRGAGVTVPVVGGDGLDSPELSRVAGAGATNVYYTTVSAPLSALPAAKTFATSYRKAFGSDPQGFAAFAYDAARVALQGVLSAAKANGGKLPSRAQVETAVRAGSYSGLLSGSVKFNAVGDRQSAKLYVMKLTGGKLSLSTSLTVQPARR
ncbi:branched-chain amino acid ABC transporter substrate-binding protein [Deinococcus actinosclerus]|uniref:Branched chain amino acid ABC transporter substrate-binding protein n=1 Tax=Deinococcus actinosclerus TaxID=1768108 RepID=A0ABM5X680_9DEIO|nr:branched-chain amino acid ABC transporter substrate-binding protein [Deinococcus actinosclerus]ALW89132.1 branched chain amino acid ABC transporter substrate-binding protein [Deinococcus actinosclerus]